MSCKFFHVFKCRYSLCRTSCKITYRSSASDSASIISRPYRSSRPLVHAVGIVSSTLRSPINSTPESAAYFGFEKILTTFFSSRCSAVTAPNIWFSLLLVCCEHIVVFNGPLSKLAIAHNVSVEFVVGVHRALHKHGLCLFAESPHVIHPRVD